MFMIHVIAMCNAGTSTLPDTYVCTMSEGTAPKSECGHTRQCTSACIAADVTSLALKICLSHALPHYIGILLS